MYEGLGERGEQKEKVGMMLSLFGRGCSPAPLLFLAFLFGFCVLLPPFGGGTFVVLLVFSRSAYFFLRSEHGHVVFVFNILLFRMCLFIVSLISV